MSPVVCVSQVNVGTTADCSKVVSSQSVSTVSQHNTGASSNPSGDTHTGGLITHTSSPTGALCHTGANTSAMTHTGSSSSTSDTFPTPARLLVLLPVTLVLITLVQ